MKNFYKLLLFTFISTSITAQYQIGDTYEDGIIYDVNHYYTDHEQHLLQIKIVEMEDHLIGNIIDVQNAVNIAQNWTVPTFTEMTEIVAFRHALISNQDFVYFNTGDNDFYWASDNNDLGYVVLRFSPINGNLPHNIYAHHINDNEETAHLRLVRTIILQWDNDTESYHDTESTEDTDNQVCGVDVNHHQFHPLHHVDLRLLQVSDFSESSCVMTVTGNTSYSQNNYGNSSSDHIYQFEVMTSGNYEFSTCGSDYDTYLRIYDANMNQLAQNDDACNFQSIVEINLAEGIYYILVEGYSTSSGDYILSTDCNFTNANSCLSGEVLDCDGSGACFPESWINDGYCDGPEQAYGVDLSCYDNEAGDCNSSLPAPAGHILDCDGSGEHFPEHWLGDGYCDGPEQVYGADLSCYDNDGGDCTESSCENDDSTTDTYGDSCTEWYDVNEYPGSHGCEGAYNSHEFNALEQCCVCQGAQENQRLIAPSESIKDGQSIIFMDISLLFDSNLNLLTLVVNDLNEGKLFYYEIYDLLGNRFFNGQLQSVETLVPIASLSPGVYVLRVNTLNNENLKTLKFIKN
tara:strand:+ start:1768 stop:3489 length:1722 start_codon:yes stop_codon:yes gene_type:complete